MGRRDYYNDPDAPKANSLVPAASAVVVDDDGRIVLQRRPRQPDVGSPGRRSQFGDSVAECAVRETREETGLDVEVTGIVGIYRDPRPVFAYDDGEVRQEFFVCLLGGCAEAPLKSATSPREVRAFEPHEIEALPMVSSIRLRITDYLNQYAPAIR